MRPWLELTAGVHRRVVQERLGHANVSVTLNTYSHVDLDMQQAIAASRIAALVHPDGPDEGRTESTVTSL